MAAIRGRERARRDLALLPADLRDIQQKINAHKAALADLRKQRAALLRRSK